MSEVEPVYAEIGARIRAARKKAGMSQEDVADRLVPPLSRTAYLNHEAGMARTPVHMLMQLAVLFGVGFWDLVPVPRAGAGNVAKERDETRALRLEVKHLRKAMRRAGEILRSEAADPLGPERD